MTPLDQPTWEDVYKNTPAEKLPWFYVNLDPDFERALAAIEGNLKRALDIGTGPGTQAIELAKRGYHVVGTDISRSAIEQARIRAREQGVEVDFRVDDILKTDIEPPFDYVFDRGVFHTFTKEDRQHYADSIHCLLRPQGYLLLKCFSHLQPGDTGPHRFSPNELQQYFKPHFNVVSIDNTIFYGVVPPIKALFSVLQRKG